MEHIADSGHANCLNCDAVLHGEYCSSCGQAAHEGHAPTLGHFGYELMHEFLHVDVLLSPRLEQKRPFRTACSGAR